MLTRPTAAAATAIDWGEIILAIAPPIILEATNNEGSTPIWVAVTDCNPANKEPLLTTEPVKNTPIQPKIGENSGNIFPVLAKASPSVEDIPEYVEIYAKANTEQIVNIGAQSSRAVSLIVDKTIRLFTLKMIIVTIAANNIAVVVDVNGAKLNTALIGVGCFTIGATRATEPSM